MLKVEKRLYALLVSTMLICMLALVACNSNAVQTDTSSADATDGSSSEMTATEGKQPSEPYGKPWIITQVTGSLPTEVPTAKDDLYTHVNYDCMSEHQSEDYNYMKATAGEVKEATIATIKDESRTGHELEQMRIFFDQAADTETLKEIGFSEVQPYIDMIDKVQSIEELNELLASDEFPFTPFVTAILGVADMYGENIVSVAPNFVICDSLTIGGTYYQEFDDPQKQAQYDTTLQVMSITALSDIDLVLEPGADVQATADAIIGFEKAYGKYSDYTSKYLSAEYGTYSKAIEESMFTLDELCALCPNVPMKEMLAKCKKDGSSIYSAPSPEWMGALNDLWTDDNLDTIKLVAKAKVLSETRPYRDQSAMFESMDIDPDIAIDPELNAFNACNNINTFAQVIAKEYADTTLGQEGKERLKKLTADLVDAYKDLVSDSAWLSDESEKLIIEKLDHMTLNVLEPESGYFDYGKLELTSTKDGGTLLSNYFKLRQYRYDREAERIGKPVTGDWVWFAIKPTEVNAFYDAVTNSINIVPGYVTSSMYSNGMSDVEVLAGIGWVIGHEISHGFDYMGSQTNAYGQPKTVFLDEDLNVFLAKCMDLADYYSTIEYLPGKFVDGKNVVGEAAADLTGLQTCLVLAEKADNTDYNQFFERAAHVWAQVLPNAKMLEAYATDTHPFPNLRVNVNAQMLEPFYQTYGVSEGDGMYLAPNKRIAIWGENA